VCGKAVEPLQKQELPQAAPARTGSERDDLRQTRVSQRGAGPRANSMSAHPHEQKKWLLHIGQQLQAEYNAAPALPLPARLTELLKQLEESRKAADEALDRAASENRCH
jgi:hypothetical protein